MVQYIKLCYLLHVFGTTIPGKLREIRLQGFLPMSGEVWPGGGACLPATLMAVRHVNERAGLLDGYNVTYTWEDSKCDASEATFRLFQSLSQPPTKVMLLGCACSIATEPTAEVSHLFNLTQISYCSASPVLSNQARFPNYYQLYQPEHAVNPARIALMREFKWTKVATINKGEEFHSMVIDDFVARLKGTNITIISQELFQHNPFHRVENLKKRDARIIVAAMYENEARMVLCFAYKVGLYGPKVVWMFYNWLSIEFWRPRNDVDCTYEEMVQAVEGAFLVGSYVINPREEKGIAGLTLSEFNKLWRQEETYDARFDEYYYCVPFSYDHVWLAALALNCTEYQLRIKGHPKYLDDFAYQDSDINNIIMSCMNNVSLIGVGGRYTYKDGPVPMNINIKIERVHDDNRVLVGTFVVEDNNPRLEWIVGSLKWKDNHIPRDATYVRHEEIITPSWLFVVMVSCSGLGILATFGCLAFNMTFRQHRIVKLSAPTTNNVLLLGSILVYSSIFMTTASNSSSTLCTVKKFCLSIGYTLAAGTLFIKTWMVYNLFIKRRFNNGRARMSRSKTTGDENFQIKKTIRNLPFGNSENTKEIKGISDHQLVVMVCVCAALVIALLALWEIISPQFLLKKELTKEVFTIGNDAEVRPYVLICSSEYGLHFTWAIYILEGTRLILGAFLAWETRNVKISEMNDSYNVSLCLYNTLVLSVFGLTVSLLLEDNIVISYGVTSTCTIAGTTLNVAIIFVPKVSAYVQGLSSVQPADDADQSCATDLAVATTSAGPQ